MLKTAQNEWTLKAVQLETAVLALEEVDLPQELKALEQAAAEKLRALFDAWLQRKPAAEPRDWKTEEKAGGVPLDKDLAEVTDSLKDEEREWTLHRASSDKGEVVETLVSEDKAWMVAGEEYYFGEWDEEAKLLEVGRDDEAGEPGTGLVLNLTGELVFESTLAE